MEALSALVQNPLFSPLCIAIAGLLLVGFFWWRAGSTHIILERLWRLMAGKAEVHDPDLKSMLDESLALEKLQFIYRVKVGTLNGAHKLAAWKKKHDLSMYDLRKLWPWIDVKSIEMVVQPPKRYVAAKLAVVGMATLAMVGISQFAMSPNAYLRMRESNILFKTNATVIKAVFEGWSFDASDCITDQSNVTRMTRFLDVETDVLCKALKDDNLKSLVKQTVEVQKWSGLVVLLIAMAIALFNLLAAATAQEAMKLRKRLYGSGANIVNKCPKQSALASTADEVAPLHSDATHHF